MGPDTMRLLSFAVHGRSSFGAVTDRGIVDLGRVLHGKVSTLRDLIAMASAMSLSEIVDRTDADYAVDEVQYRPPVPEAARIICIGVNYANRDAEYDDREPPPQYPSVFMRTRESLVAHNEAILRPRESQELDYEGEIVAVIGKPGRRIPQNTAAQHIAGWTLMNEGTVRDWLRHGKFNVTQGKNFEKSGSIGPWIVTADAVSDLARLQLTTWVNGDRRQYDNTANMMFPICYLVSYLSVFMELKAGDLIATGTPTGAGARLDPPSYLEPGDRIVIEVPEIGRLTNHIEDE